MIYPVCTGPFGNPSTLWLAVRMFGGHKLDPGASILSGYSHFKRSHMILEGNIESASHLFLHSSPETVLEIVLHQCHRPHYTQVELLCKTRKTSKESRNQGPILFCTGLQTRCLPSNRVLGCFTSSSHLGPFFHLLHTRQIWIRSSASIFNAKNHANTAKNMLEKKEKKT